MESKPRNIWVAAVLTFLTTGLGHIYAGEMKKGIYLYVGQFFLLLISSLLIVASPSPLVLVFAVILLITYSIYAIYDAALKAKSGAESYQPKKYNKISIYVLIYAVAVFLIKPVIGNSIKKNIVQTSKISGGSMIPTILIGDQIIVSNLAFRTSKPKRYDTITFKPPHKDNIYVKRVIGLEGDIIEIKEKVLYVNNKKMDENYIVHSDERIFPEHISKRDNFSSFKVPEGHVFLMGDNRDNSNDSRFYGSIDIKDVYGKVIFIYWSWDSKKNRIRWKRVFKRF